MNGLRFVAALDSNIMQIPEIPQSGRKSSHLLQLFQFRDWAGEFVLQALRL